MKNDMLVVYSDRSKTFDCLPHGLLISKCAAYNVHHVSCSVLISSFCKRQQRAQQGSVMGPFCTMFYQWSLANDAAPKCNIFNYADDNASSKAISGVKRKFKASGTEMATRFKENFMQADPNKGGRGSIPDRITSKTWKMGGLRFSAWYLALMS